MGRLLILIYGVVSYLIFFVTFLYLIVFVGNFDQLPFVGKTIDSGSASGVGGAMLINLGLLLLFGATHTVMARPWFKARWTRIVPEAAERSTYVLVASASLIVLYLYWQPMTESVWQVSGEATSMALWVLYFGGFGIVLLSTFLINHFELFGLSQVLLNMQKRAPTGPSFVQPLLYKLVRHPLYLGWIMAFWATPEMTTGHLLFAIVMTAQILISIPHEERDIEDALGEAYLEYKQKTPMLIPFLKSRN